MTHYLSKFPHRVVEDSPSVLSAGFLYLKDKGHNKVVYITSEDSEYDGIRDDAAATGVELKQLCYPLELWTVDTERQAYLNMCRSYC